MADGLVILQAQVGLTDPHVVNDNADSLNILNSLFEPLVQRTRDGFRPCLARSWHVGEDARTWEFSLRTGVKFHDGTTLTAEDAVASLERARSPDVGGVLGTEGLFHGYLGAAVIAIVDRHTVRLVTAEPMADVPDLIASIPILPAAAMDTVLENPVGSGPYRLLDASEQATTMAAHGDHWQSRPPAFARLAWKVESDPAQGLRQLQLSEADLVTGVSHEMGLCMEADEQTRLRTAPSNVCTVFMCNLLQGVCTDTRVRQALNYGFDQALLIERITHGSALPLAGPLTVKHTGHDPAVAPYPHDPEKARGLLAEAGWGQGLSLVLDVPLALPDEAVDVASFLAEQYAHIGIETEIATHADRPAYAQRVKAKAIHDACCFDSSPISTFRALREKFHGGLQGPWWLGYGNESLDRTLNLAQATVDPDRRRQLYRSAYRTLHADAPWIYLYNQLDRWGLSPRLADWRPTVDGLISVA